MFLDGYCSLLGVRPNFSEVAYLEQQHVNNQLLAEAQKQQKELETMRTELLELQNRAILEDWKKKF